MPRSSFPGGYIRAVILTAAALVIGYAGRGVWDTPAVYSLLLAAVMLSSWRSGLGPGLLSTIVGTIAADYFLLAPIHSITFNGERLIQLSAFIGAASLISWLNDARARLTAALDIERQQLDARVQARTADLSRAERNVRGLLESAPDAIIVIDGTGRIVQINAETERLFGYARTSLIGQLAEVIIPERFRAQHRAGRERYAAHPAPRLLPDDLSGLRADGTEFPVEIRVNALESELAPLIVATIRDVTERRRALEVQQRLVHDLGERVKELTALHHAARILNESDPAVDVLAHVVEILPPAWQYPDIAEARIVTDRHDVRTPRFTTTPWLQRAEFEISASERGAIEVVYLRECPPADEGPFLAEERNLIQSAAGLLQAYCERLRGDERRLQVARAEAAAAEAQQANQAKDQFLATLSHELRAPLNVMLGWTRILRGDGVDDAVRSRGLEVIERSVNLQAKLIEDLLDVSRIVTGKLRIDRQHVDLSVVAAAAADGARPTAASRGIAFTADIADGLWMDADAVRLQQVISNMLTNALKFTPRGGTVSLRVERAEANALITVSDTGIGIAPDLLPWVFDRFRQGDSSTTRSHGGLGLGLAIVKHLVELHGGTIQAESGGPDGGATFTTILPLADDVVPVTVQSGAFSTSSLLTGIHVLVVDDDADARSMLMTILEQCGAAATAVGSADEALAALALERPDVLLSDIGLPRQDGCDMLRRIRSTAHFSFPAAALSAYADADHRARAFDAGFQIHLAKPVEPGTLVTALARLVHRA